MTENKLRCGVDDVRRRKIKQSQCLAAKYYRNIANGVVFWALMRRPWCSGKTLLLMELV